MAKIFVKMYSSYIVSGKDFGVVPSDKMRRLLFSPDDIHSASIVELKGDGCLCISIPSRTPFDFSISRNGKVLANVAYRGQSSLHINSNWRLTESGVSNREIHTNPDLRVSKTLNFEIEGEGIDRIDLKIDQSGHAACVFTKNELLFMRMNGNHCVPRLEGFIGNQVEQAKKESGKRFFAKWVEEHEWGMK